jgi:hypothetical protein
VERKESKEFFEQISVTSSSKPKTNEDCKLAASPHSEISQGGAELKAWLTQAGAWLP